MSAPTSAAPAAFAVKRLAHIEDDPRSAAWLVDGLWAEQAVGFIAGPPKAGKTWLSLELAIAVATGTPALGRFPVRERGPVLLYAAEDAPAAIKQRARAIAEATGRRDFDRIAVGVIHEDAVRLDRDTDLNRLAATLEAVRPRLLVLDPLVRLHRADENSAGDISRLLADLRLLQRLHHVAIAVVHHVRKAQADQPGQALRGSGDLHAWADSSLYLVRQNDGVVIRTEHRAHQSPEPIHVELATAPAPHLRLARPPVPAATPPDANDALTRRILAVLANGPHTRATLRETLAVRNETLGAALQSLEAAGRLARHDGYLVPVPAP